MYKRQEEKPLVAANSTQYDRHLLFSRAFIYDSTRRHIRQSRTLIIGSRDGISLPVA